MRVGAVQPGPEYLRPTATKAPPWRGERGDAVVGGTMMAVNKARTVVVLVKYMFRFG